MAARMTRTPLPPRARIRHAAALLVTAFAAAAIAQPTQAQDVKPAAEQVIVPQVDRRDVKPPRLPSRDFALGLYAGTYAAQNFGTHGVSGLRLAYHVTEDVFIDATVGRSKVSDEMFRRVLPGGIFVKPTATLSYTNVAAGYNLLPGEVFFGRGDAKLSQGYVLAGIGSTRFAGQTRQTLHAGFGLRLVLKDWFALQADVRDHMYSLDLLGKRQNTHNLEVTAGLTAYF